MDDRLPDLTRKQLDAALLYHRAWHTDERGVSHLRCNDPAIGVDGRVQVINRAISGFSFGSTTISVLKRHDLIKKTEWGYVASERLRRLMPDPPRPQ